MENASKALIIAGSILLAILIIGVGIMIFYSVNIDVEPQMTQIEVNVFNQEYLLYEGVQLGKRVKELLVKAAYYNAGEENPDREDGVSSKTYGIGIRSNNPDILDKASSKGHSWVSALNGERNYGVIQPVNMREIANWLRPNKRYKVLFNFFENGRIREIIIDDVN